MRKRFKQICHWRRYTTGQETYENCSTSLVIWEMKIEPQWDNTRHPLGCWKFKRLTILNIREHTEKLQLSYTAGGHAEWYKRFGKLTISLKVKHRVTIWCSNSTPRYLPKRREDTHPHETCTWMFTVALCLIAKTTQMPTDRQTDKKTKRGMNYWYTQQHGWISNNYAVQKSWA